jgi:hypothetical protein
MRIIFITPLYCKNNFVAVSKQQHSVHAGDSFYFCAVGQKKLLRTSKYCVARTRLLFSLSLQSFACIFAARASIIKALPEVASSLLLASAIPRLRFPAARCQREREPGDGAFDKCLPKKKNQQLLSG